MKPIAIALFLNVGLVGLMPGRAHHKSIKEGTWRGVFTVNEQQVPFNFELRA